MLGERFHFSEPVDARAINALGSKQLNFFNYACMVGSRVDVLACHSELYDGRSTFQFLFRAASATTMLTESTTSSEADQGTSQAENTDQRDQSNQRISEEALRYFRARRHISEDVVDAPSTSQNNDVSRVKAR